MTTNDLVSAPYAEDIARWEGLVDYLYCDSIGLVTIGIGNLVKTEEVVVSLPLRHRDLGIVALPETKKVAFRACMKIYRKAIEEGQRPPSHKVYRYASNLFLTKEIIFGMLEARLKNEFIPGIKKKFPEFDKAPLPARKALVDIAYNCGVAGFSKFTHMLEYANVGLWEGCAHSCRRKSSRDERNDWAKNMFLEAAEGKS